MRGLPFEVKSLIQKARESALLAVETYNRPTATFRSGAYLVLMVIAWTSLFHAIFFHKGMKPFYRKQGSKRFLKINGEFKRWELAECLRRYFQEDNPPERTNLEFFIALRNKVEHCSLAQLDPEIFGECQALLLNFENALCSEFGDRFAIRGGLTYALQFSRIAPRSQVGASAKQEQKSFRAIKSFIDSFRSGLSTEVQSDLAYSFKVFLVPKIGNHASADAIAVEFVRYDPNKPEEMKQYEKVVSLIKPKEVRVANLGLLRPGQVVAQVRSAIGKPFNMHHHMLCYRHFNARPPKKSSDPTACETRYCVYDSAHSDYVYTPEWVQHLSRSLSDSAVYDALFIKKAQQPQLALAAGGSAA